MVLCIALMLLCASCGYRRSTTPARPVFILEVPDLIANRQEPFKLKLRVEPDGPQPVAILASNIAFMSVWATNNVYVDCTGFVRLVGVDPSTTLTVQPDAALSLDIEAYDFGGAGDWPKERRRDWATGDAGFGTN